MKKPDGTFRCLACGGKWQGSQLHLDPTLTAVRWTCGDLFCGGTVVANEVKRELKVFSNGTDAYAKIIERGALK